MDRSPKWRAVSDPRQVAHALRAVLATGFVVNVNQYPFHAHHRHGPVGSVRARGVTSHHS